MPCLRFPAAPRAEPLIRLRSRPLRIALVGNPNVGKSAVFGRLTGRYATVSNYPGTTVGIMRGRAMIGAEVFEVVDTPGVNTLEGSLSEDERITRGILCNGEADLIVQIADARNLRRTLALTWQLAALGKPTVLALNMADEARMRGVSIDVDRLQHAVGIPVVATVATEGQGLDDLRSALTRAGVPSIDAPAGDGANWVDETTDRCRRIGSGRAGRVQEGIARAVRQPLTGVPILALVLYAVYLFVGVFGAQTLVGWFENQLFGAWINPAAIHLTNRFVPFEPVRSFFVGEYGVITMGLTYAIAIVLPVVTTFFLIFGFLEDSGYIPRLAIFTDRTFRGMGLNGKAVLPMVLGLGCDTMATMTTRILRTPKERLIAILLLALGIPCSAQLATIMGILGGISFGALVTLFGIVLAQLFLVGFLASRILPGERSEFVMELPPIRLPRWRNLAIKTWLRVRWYLGEAVPLFLIGTALLFVLDRAGLLHFIVAASRPIVHTMLGLPDEAAQVFVMGFLRRDYGAAGLFDLARTGQLSANQAVVALTVMTLFVPCVANFLMIVRERGWNTALAILGVITPIALVTGAALHAGLDALGISF